MQQAESNEITIPVKRYSGETVEERLDDTVLNHTLPARYLKKDENGNVIEEPHELFERVGKNIALAEVVYEANKLDHVVTATPEDIKPDHPRRGELAAEVFGFDGRRVDSVEDVPNDLDEARDYLLDEEVALTESNINRFSYDTIVPGIEHEELKNHVESMKDEFVSIMSELKFMPNSPTLMNAGDELQQLSACFVMSPDDDMNEIYDTQRKAAAVFQSGGGTGYAFSDLRPYGDIVGSTGGIASGPITFMESYDKMCETVAQGGARRGAQMGLMRVTHPDIVQFIHSKDRDVSLADTLRLNDPDDFTHNSFAEALEEARDLIDEDGRVPEHLRNAVEGHLSNFNISVGITDDFMEAVKNDEDYELINPRTGEVHIANEHTVELYERFGLGEYVEEGEELTIPAQEIWHRIAEGAHENGEPGIIMLDRANEEHVFPVESSPGPEHSEHEILASNPCGEQLLEEYEACNLGHINLSTVVAKNPAYGDRLYILDEGEADHTAQDFREWHKQASAHGYDGDKDDPEHIRKFLEQAIDWEELVYRIDIGLRFLDNVSTMSDFPIDEIERTVMSNRKVGLGIMGLAQMFIQLGLKYGKPPANEAARQLLMFINRRAKQVSHNLATVEQRGTFDNWEESKYADPVEYKEWFKHETGEDPERWAEMSEKGGFEMRNSTVTTIAPTGTTSQIGRTSGGCEPIFSVVNFRSSSSDVHDGGLYVEMDDYFRGILEANGIDPEEVKEQAVEQMNNDNFDGIEGLSTVPDKLSELFRTATDVLPKEHAALQCAVQDGIDSSISKTINAPNDSTVEDAKSVFEFVYDNGGKGVTYYRDGSRSKQVKTTRKQNRKFADLDEHDNPEEVILEQITDAFGDQGFFEFLQTDAVVEEINGNADSLIDLIDDTELEGEYKHVRQRPKVLRGVTTVVKTGYGKLYVTINVDDDGQPLEVFVETGKSGGLFKSSAESIGKLVSIALRSGVDPEEIIDVLENIRAPKVGFDQGETIQSIPDGVATALKRYLNGELQKNVPTQQLNTTKETPPASGQNEDKHSRSRDGDKAIIESGETPVCPECGSTSLYYSEGCQTCEECGWSKC